MDNTSPSSPTTRRVMLITGGSRGIGAATAVLAAKAGYAVAINYRATTNQQIVHLTRSLFLPFNKVLLAR